MQLCCCKWSGWLIYVRKTFHKHHNLLYNTCTLSPSLKRRKKNRQKQRNALFSMPGFISAFWANLNSDIQQHVAVFHGVWIYYETMVVLCCNDDSYIIPSSAGAIWNSGAAVVVTVKVTLKGVATMSCLGAVSWQDYLWRCEDDCHLSYNTHCADYNFSQGPRI